MKHPLRNTVLYVAGSIVVAALLGAPFSARAAGLGELRLHSGLGQPLNAEIEILSAEGDAQARLLPGEDADPALNGIRFRVVDNGKRAVLRLSTGQPLSTPFAELPVELSSDGTRVMRRYTLLLDLPAAK